MTQRIQRHPFLALFDGADTNASTGRAATSRPSPTGAVPHERPVRPRAGRAASPAGCSRTRPTTPARIELAFRLAFGRPADGRRSASSAGDFLADYRDELAGDGVAGRPRDRRPGRAWPASLFAQQRVPVTWIDAVTRPPEDLPCLRPAPTVRRDVLRVARRRARCCCRASSPSCSPASRGRTRRAPTRSRRSRRTSPPKAKRVIFLFMTGGVSHVDTFDPKPKLFADHGKTVTIDDWQGRPGKYSRYLKRPHWEFRPRGKCGTEVSDLFPHVARVRRRPLR